MSRKRDVRHDLEREWELSIGPETVRLFILKARAISAALNHDYESGGEHEIELDDQVRDAHHHDGLAEEEEENLTEWELRALLEDLNVDEAAELVALTWIGRGDYVADEWAEAVQQARQRANTRISDYLLGMPMLGDYLEEGLEAIIPA